MKDKIYFVVEMLRWGDREQHSYIAGIYDDELLALIEGWSHSRYRAEKYTAEITGRHLNGGIAIYKRELTNWAAFLESSPDLAKKVQEALDKEDKDES